MPCRFVCISSHPVEQKLHYLTGEGEGLGYLILERTHIIKMHKLKLDLVLAFRILTLVLLFPTVNPPPLTVVNILSITSLGTLIISGSGRKAKNQSDRKK